MPCTFSEPRFETRKANDMSSSCQKQRAGKSPLVFNACDEVLKSVLWALVDCHKTRPKRFWKNWASFRAARIKGWTYQSSYGNISYLRKECGHTCLHSTTTTISPALFRNVMQLSKFSICRSFLICIQHTKHIPRYLVLMRARMRH